MIIIRKSASGIQNPDLGPQFLGTAIIANPPKPPKIQSFTETTHLYSILLITPWSLLQSMKGQFRCYDKVQKWRPKVFQRSQRLRLPTALSIVVWIASTVNVCAMPVGETFLRAVLCRRCPALPRDICVPSVRALLSESR